MSGLPQTTEEEREELFRRAERDGYRPRERCECAEPDPGIAGGNRWLLPNVCLRCRRRLALPSEAQHPGAKAGSRR